MRTASLLALLAFLASPALAQNADRGRMLYETYCGECHYARVHQRSPEKSSIKTLANLRDTVAARSALTRFRFSLDDVEDVVQYLNQTHYKLQK